MPLIRAKLSASSWLITRLVSLLIVHVYLIADQGNTDVVARVIKHLIKPLLYILKALLIRKIKHH